MFHLSSHAVEGRHSLFKDPFFLAFISDSRLFFKDYRSVSPDVERSEFDVALRGSPLFYAVPFTFPRTLLHSFFFLACPKVHFDLT